MSCWLSSIPSAPRRTKACGSALTFRAFIFDAVRLYRGMASSNTEHRKLAAIMFTDMVGYSALSQSDEALALDLLAESQRLLRSQFPLFNGREVKTTGDGFLVEFPNALHATQCAIEIQRLLA